MIELATIIVLLLLAFAIRNDHAPAERALDTWSWIDWIETAGLV